MFETTVEIRIKTGHEEVRTTFKKYKHVLDFVNKDMQAVMGKGIALLAKKKFPWLPIRLGHDLCCSGSRVCYMGEGIIAFPVKNNWFDKKADRSLIRNSCKQLRDLIKSSFISIMTVYLPKPGCGVGGLNWETEVKPIIEEELGELDNLIIIG